MPPLRGGALKFLGKLKHYRLKRVDNAFLANCENRVFILFFTPGD